VIKRKFILYEFIVGRVWRIVRVDSRRHLGQVLYSQLHVALQREIPAQYPCCFGITFEWTWRSATEI